MIKEWSNKYNSFNSSKVLVHKDYWKPITEGNIPPPLFLSIDPNGSCDFGCTFCNAKESIKENKSDKLSIEDIGIIKDVLLSWNTRAVCVAGGGEPLLNENTEHLISSLTSNNIKVGLITNGHRLDKFIETVQKCEWVGISVDAGTPKTFAKIKGVSEKAFLKVLDNMQYVSQFCDLTYKYLVHPDNCHEIYEAVSLAKSVGCSVFHSRPGGDAWFNLDKGEFQFDEKSIETYSAQLELARRDFEDENFKVFGIVHKFTDGWNIKHSFNKCHATFTNCYISPKGMVGLCCDRRGDSSLELCHISEAKEMWGSDKHKELVNNIRLNQCPRCTYTHVNEMFENVILRDNWLANFI
jgi:MoaA/NifB/PqqE/SkfB family radical SAM enzyme